MSDFAYPLHEECGVFGHTANLLIGTAGRGLRCVDCNTGLQFPEVMMP